jgi:predicted dehydrogenase
MGALSFGIMGTGVAARAFTRALKAIGSVTVTAVGSRSDDTARRFAELFRIPRAHGSYAALASDPSVDVVYIATPAAAHKENALLCLSSGKSVLIEKPFAVTAAEAGEIIGAARSAKRFCMEAMWTRFLPATRRFLARAESGEIGELHQFTADFGGPVIYDAHHHRFDSRAGGAWLDRGIYGLSLAMALFGPPSKLRADALIAETGCDLQANAILEFPARRTAVISASNLAYSSNEAVIAGSLGRLRLAEPFVRSDVVTARMAPVSSTNPTAERRSGGWRNYLKESKSARSILSLVPRDTREFSPFEGNGYGHQALEVVRCIQAGLTESPMMSLEESLAIMEVSDAVRATWLQWNRAEATA